MYTREQTAALKDTIPAFISGETSLFEEVKDTGVNIYKRDTLDQFYEKIKVKYSLTKPDFQVFSVVLYSQELEGDEFHELSFAVLGVTDAESILREYETLVHKNQMAQQSFVDISPTDECRIIRHAGYNSIRSAHDITTKLKTLVQLFDAMTVTKLVPLIIYKDSTRIIVKAYTGHRSPFLDRMMASLLSEWFEFNPPELDRWNKWWTDVKIPPKPKKLLQGITIYSLDTTYFVDKEKLEMCRNIVRSGTFKDTFYTEVSKMIRQTTINPRFVLAYMQMKHFDIRSTLGQILSVEYELSRPYNTYTQYKVSFDCSVCIWALKHYILTTPSVANLVILDDKVRASPPYWPIRYKTGDLPIYGDGTIKFLSCGLKVDGGSESFVEGGNRFFIIVHECSGHIAVTKAFVTLLTGYLKVEEELKALYRETIKPGEGALIAITKELQIVGSGLFLAAGHTRIAPCKPRIHPCHVPDSDFYITYPKEGGHTYTSLGVESNSSIQPTYIGLSINNTRGRYAIDEVTLLPLYPLIPKLFATPQYSDPNTLMYKYCRGLPLESKQKRGGSVISSKKVAPVGRRAILPSSPILKGRWFRFGVKQGPHSFIEAVLVALSLETSVEDVLKYITEHRYPLRALASQEMYEWNSHPSVTDRLFDEMLYGTNSTILDQKYFNPFLFIRILEFIFGVSIHLFGPKGNRLLPNYLEFYAKYYSVAQRHIAISVNVGTEFGLLDYPQCEPIGQYTDRHPPAFIITDPEIIASLYGPPILPLSWGSNEDVANPIFLGHTVIKQHLTIGGRCDAFLLDNGFTVQVITTCGEPRSIAPMSIPFGDPSDFESVFTLQEVLDAFNPIEYTVRDGIVMIGWFDDLTLGVSLTGDIESEPITSIHKHSNTLSVVLAEYGRYKYSHFIRGRYATTDSVDEFVDSHFIASDTEHTGLGSLHNFAVLRDDVVGVHIPAYIIAMMRILLKREMLKLRNRYTDNIIGGYYTDATSFRNSPQSLQVVYYRSK